MDIDYSVEPLNKVGYKGQIYLLVDSSVYSSSESFAAFSKETKWAALVGTTTGGDGIGMSPSVSSLPNSGLVYRFPTCMGINYDGTINEETHAKPDIFAEETYGDYLNDISWRKYNKDAIISPYDTIINKVLEIINKLYVI